MTKPTTSSNLLPLVYLTEREKRGTHLHKYAPEAVQDGLFGQPDLLVGCPMADAATSANVCRECPYLKGIGELDTVGAVPAVEQKYRLLCGFPVKRKLTPVAAEMPPEIRASLEQLYDDHANKTAPQAEMEYELFVRTAHAVNCPISRQTTGAWLAVAPPCVGCRYYGGVGTKRLKDGEEVPCVACSHEHALAAVKVNLAPQLARKRDGI